MTDSLEYLYIYATDECNLACTHCWRSAPRAARPSDSQLRFDQCERFLDDALTLGLRSVTISGGEPLLNSDLPRFLEYCQANCLSCMVETNGSLLGGQAADALLRYDVGWAVSLDGSTAESHEQQRGQAGAFAATIRGMRKLDKQRIPYQVIMAVSGLNRHDVIPLLSMLGQAFSNCRSVKINVILPEGRARDMEAQGHLLSAAQCLDLIDEVGRVMHDYPFRVMLHLEPVFFSLELLRQRLGCGGACGYHHALSVLADGSVSICSLGVIVSDYVFGHVTTIDLPTLWETNPSLRALRDDGYKKLTGVCSRCIFRAMCRGGCRAHALLTYGDVFAPAPLCQTYYDSGAFPQSRLR